MIACRTAVALLACALTPTIALPQGLAVTGHDRALVAAPPGIPLADYENSGYRLHRQGEHWEVDVDLAPLASRAPFRLPAARSRDPLSLLARRVVSGASRRYDAVSRILGWVAANVRYDLDRRETQSAEAVLARRSGFCTGIARLSVALLAAVGIPAREVAGYVAARPGGEAGISGFHRWIEVFYPDRGWVFSDPLSTHHYVPASYLRLAGGSVAWEQLRDPGRIAARANEVVPIDVAATAPSWITVRRNDRRQRAASLRVLAPQPLTSGLAVLERAGRRYTQELRQGRCSFVGLSGGRYRLRLVVGGLPPLERNVELADRRAGVVDLAAKAATAETGR